MISKRKPTFFTSDWHIGHEKVIEFSQRPFENCDEMHRHLIKQYNSIVSENGICYFLGDVGLCSGELIKSVLDKLNGTKVLIRGNHDSKINSMYNKGFDVVLNTASITICNKIVTMSHQPLYATYREDTSKMLRSKNENWHGESRATIGEFTLQNYDQFHLHGHIHSPNRGRSKKILDKQYDVGVDANNYKPVSISQIESWISKYE